MEMEPPSSPPSGLSRFTARHLMHMGNYTTSTPLRIIAHIDLDAFYAQCEMVRLDIPRDKPLGVRQWHGLIAINYPAREFGIKRHTTVADARKLCPHMIFQHVATWREGDTKWAYRPDSARNVASDKVSLDPYRLESRKIMKLITENLPPGNMQKVEKASIDEVFIDLSAQIQAELLRNHPELQQALETGQQQLSLPNSEDIALDWAEDEVIPLSEEDEQQAIDWDDVALCIGARIVRELRLKIFQELKYTCSGGVSVNKLLSKLGSGHKKPNAQTVIRSRAVGLFLAELKFTKLRNLGGKLGEKVASEFGTEDIAQIMGVSLGQLNARLGPETGTWVYNTVRGVDTSEVTPRTQIKSMLSAKQFRPAISSKKQATSWFHIFSADIFARMVDLGVSENKIRPRTLALHYTGGSGNKSKPKSKSKSANIPQGKAMSVELLVDTCEALFASLFSEGYTWPCEHLSVSVSGFEEGVTGNMGIGGFLVRGAKATATAASTRAAIISTTDDFKIAPVFVPRQSRSTAAGKQTMEA
ncbi:N-acetyltransferase eso1 [Ceratocystis platani]|uniref:DNA polymerase eta n=1 Tax=Ceratocystis fimbriata f. sp. platani TaxID=88771 RepID=A0A0F8AZR0_CERFI|nr:N-acetyltransferase eso1 [Ceratocystis platani]